MPDMPSRVCSADTARDPRGFAVKFYTEEGNWDLVGNNTPVFFIRCVSGSSCCSEMRCVASLSLTCR